MARAKKAATGAKTDGTRTRSGRHRKPATVGSRAADAVHAYANAPSVTGRKPSTLKRAAAGAVAGGATGASLAGPPGAAVGAALGGGAAGIAARREKAADRRTAGGTPRRLLVAEFALCMAIVAFSPLTKKDETPGAWMKRATAVMGLFFLLGLIASAGRGAGKAAAGFGGLVTVVLAVSERDVFTALAAKFTATNDAAPAGPGPEVPDNDWLAIPDTSGGTSAGPAPTGRRTSVGSSGALQTGPTPS